MSSINREIAEKYPHLASLRECQRRAMLDGVLFGLCALTISGLLGKSVFKFPRNTLYLSTFGTTALSAYLFTTASFKQCRIIQDNLEKTEEKKSEVFLPDSE
ncbi:hypothetical protein K493DRAFT_412071 [Basidiobolus meristosporus CBS 931.73]|uniref:Cytochrome c oxidase assembly protein COX20, mitochondrial n=1 Tax=Basidiobolus meristosporus CBS 931.73 TaxID=1314790 RepID=A0A1Y1X5N4_9FUNG|nr:hypothetical protein K493DRAFT_412071 [Basidiobolus meristosporus CBS 931.73]|eukprot:ORX80955.1 hypothetical protein K493DRAFT_412071 [Basidiobolus meristosporus CBS 931.73]